MSSILMTFIDIMLVVGCFSYLAWALREYFSHDRRGHLILSLALLAALMILWGFTVAGGEGGGTAIEGSADASTMTTTGGARRFTWYDDDGTEHYFKQNEVALVQDNQTGVRYLVVRDAATGDPVTMCALLDSDGSPDTDPEAGK